MKGKNFSRSEIDTVFRLKESNATWKTISVALNSPIQSLKNMYTREKLMRCLPPKEKVSKTTVTGRFAMLCKRIVLENPDITYPDFPKKIKEIIGEDQLIPNYKAFERFLKQSGYKILKLLKKPLITPINIQKRIDFAKNYSEKHPDFWEYVIWSDEFATWVRFYIYHRIRIF